MSLPPLIPRDVLFGNPERAAPRISPDGTRLAYLAPDEGVLNVWVGPMGGEAKPVTRDRDRGVRAYDWTHDGTHLVYIQDEGGDEDWHLHVVDPETGDDVDVTPFEGVQARIVAAQKRFPHELLVAINRDNPQLHDVYHLDLRTLELVKRVENPGFVGWMVDAELRVRGAMRPLPDGSEEILVGDPDDPASFEVVARFPHEDALASHPVGFTLDGSGLLLVSSVGANAGRLVRLDLASGDSDVIVEDAQYDVAGVMRHPDTWEVQMVSILRERVEHLVLDPDIEGDIAALEARHPDADVAVVGRDHADRTWLVAATADDGPVRYEAWNRETGEATFLFEHRPELNRYTLAKVEPFSFTSRDGLTIHGYLTFPPGVDRSALPTVLNVHGGPWTRDVWGFDPEAQWLANRGYLCVQVNYRGSTGYGKDFVNAGDREWGAKMHDDLVDAVEWVVGEGY
ncbi:MAG TPA: prolyl oligopeptidase family serine peptidase, partial [Acidimicrobiia bacterium]|nr:prolyl oligopeptidase family serine peptidase [Acidimicrobiia bacterium]